MRPLHSTALAVIVLTMAGGCHVGPSVATYPPATTPFGAVGKFKVGKTSFDAELLAVRDSALVLLRDREVIVVRFADLASSSFRHVDVSVSRTQRPSSEELAQLRILSRFPQGLSAELEKELLERYGQAALVVVGK